MTIEELQTKLVELDNGVLKSGAHSEGPEFCALEFDSKLRGRDWSDAPVTLPDLRSLNDAPWSSDEARTAALLPVMAALWDWSDWSITRRAAWASAVAIASVRALGDMDILPEEIRNACHGVADLSAARSAAESARSAAWSAAESAARPAAWSAAESARSAARSAAESARSAAWSAAAWSARSAAAADQILEAACASWVSAARLTEGL